MEHLCKFEDLIKIESDKEVLDMRDSVGNLPLIIAMKGDAYTGKTTSADAIAKSYRCSVIRFDTILDSIAPSLPPSPKVAQDLAFDIIVSVVKVQLRRGRPAVIDSPLSDPSHLDKLIKLADEFKQCVDRSCDRGRSRLVIVECKPEADREYAWKMRFLNKCGSSHDKWYKPKEWTDVVNAMTESVKDYPPKRLPDYVSRLIVDTTNHFSHRYLSAATLDLCGCPKGHLLFLRDWLPDNTVHKGYDAMSLMDVYSGRGQPEHSGQPRAIICGDDGRHLLEELTTLDGHGHDLGSCAASGEPIKDPPAYVCKRCNLALHKGCAELHPRSMIDHPNELPPFLRKITSRVSNVEFQAMIPEEYRRISCGSCNEFSVDCEACLWEVHLRSRAVPTVLFHRGHNKAGDHSICFWITRAGNAREYQCDACKETGWFVGYTCLQGTFRYNFHVECALLRTPRRHVHGGHDHVMWLSIGSGENTDDYICNECEKPRDPTAWCYACTYKEGKNECKHVIHLHCVYAPVDSDTDT